ncbi:SGNH hydrolase-type esterase domain-containing protein [Xylariales sp. PMI_506]|nr:SGNH hydrolase-type esterase domain-containing protein [Xylariales sp. PMI_506]
MSLVPDIGNPSLEDVQRRIQAKAKFKERSFQTSRDNHIPTLQACSSGPRIVLLGDSMLERMQTTGSSLNFDPWPSEALLDAVALDSISASWLTSIHRLDGVFNAGVGGDKYENILYRLAGDQERRLQGLLGSLKGNEIDLWLFHAGTNNLHTKKGLTDASIDALRLVLEAILQISRLDAQILVAGLHYRKDISDDLINNANTKISTVVREINTKLETERICYLSAPSEIDRQLHLDDHVHLNIKGYRIWMRTLLPAMVHILKTVRKELSEHEVLTN